METRDIIDNSSQQVDDVDWLPISDLMTGLMTIFLFISISYMLVVQLQKERMLRVAETYVELNRSLYEDLMQEFKDDLPRWSAHLDSTSLSVTFQEPDVLFLAGSVEIRPRFEEILSDFFPRYLGILTKSAYKAQIAEVRIEGHTSSEWVDLPYDSAYFYNMALSQGRTRSVLKYVIGLVGSDSSMVTWLRSHATANGLSSSKLIVASDGTEDAMRSRRVEFRVRTNAEARIAEITRAGN